MDLVKKYAEAAEYVRKRNLELEAMGFKKLQPGSGHFENEVSRKSIDQSKRAECSVFNTLYESAGFGKRDEKFGFIKATVQQLRHRDFIKRDIILADNSREKIEQLFLPLEYFLLALESQLLTLSSKHAALLSVFDCLRMQAFELRNMAREIKQEILSCSDSKPAVSDADDEQMELILEALAKENKQGCQCCCDSPGNNADEDIHADTITH